MWSLLEEFHWRAERGRRLHYIMSNDELNMSTRGRVNLETHFFQMPGLEKGEREISKIKGGIRGNQVRKNSSKRSKRYKWTWVWDIDGHLCTAKGLSVAFR